MFVKSLVKIEGYFCAIFATKTCQKLKFTSIILAVKSSRMWTLNFAYFSWIFPLFVFSLTFSNYTLRNYH